MWWLAVGMMFVGWCVGALMVGALVMVGSSRPCNHEWCHICKWCGIFKDDIHE